MRSRDEVLREFGYRFPECATPTEGDLADRIAQQEARIRELESQQAASEPVAWDRERLLVILSEVVARWSMAGDDYRGRQDAYEWGVNALTHAHPSADSVTVTDEMVNAAARRGRDYGFNAYCDNAQEYWAAMESVLTAALTRPTTPTRGSDE